MKRAALLMLAAPPGCEDPLKPAELVEEPRVLGVRVGADGDRASLDVGQSAAFDVLVAGPDGALNARLAYALCEAAPTDRGVPSCEREAFAAAAVDLDGTPLAIDVPADLPEGARLALLGVACLQGEPALAAEPLDWRCDGGEQPLRLSFDAWTTSAEFANQNPDLSSATVTLAGVEVPRGDVRAPASCEPGAFEVAAGATHGVEITLGAGAAEPGEALQISHFSTRGLLERQFSFVSAGGEARVSLGWEAPGVEVAANHYVVVRDGRGGVSWLGFGVCAR